MSVDVAKVALLLSLKTFSIIFWASHVIFNFEQVWRWKHLPISVQWSISIQPEKVWKLKMGIEMVDAKTATRGALNKKEFLKESLFW